MWHSDSMLHSTCYQTNQQKLNQWSHFLFYFPIVYCGTVLCHCHYCGTRSYNKRGPIKGELWFQTIFLWLMKWFIPLKVRIKNSRNTCVLIPYSFLILSQEGYNFALITGLYVKHVMTEVLT